MIGEKFGRLTVIGQAPSDPKSKNVRLLCKCDCGNETIVGSHNLRTKSILSCGCFHAEQNTVHGMSNTNLYSRWISMKKRCYNSNEKCFKDYGGRGIFVDELWRDNFKEFYDWATSNGWNPELELDRIDNNGPYSPENCRWITHQQNCINRIR